MRLAFHVCGAFHTLDLQGLLVLLLAGMTSASVGTDLPPWVSGTGRSWGANHIQAVKTKTKKKKKEKDPSSKPFFSSTAALALYPLPALLTEWHVFVK